MARVRLEDIARQIEQTHIVESISFEVPDGEFWVLVGPSGCGKSTLLRLIAGLDRPTSGSLYIGDRCVNAVSARERDVAMVFQNYALYPHLTVAENLAFGLKMRGVDRQTIYDRVQTVARSLNITHLLERKPGQLSGGQQQRVALGRAIARKPQVFLLDEPLSNLDAQLRDEMRAELKQLHQQLGITTLYVTHDQTEAMTLADHIIVLKQGRIQQMGDPQTIYAKPANQMVATFLGSPPMNLLPANVTPTGFQVGRYPIGAATAPSTLPPTVVLGLRPEHITVAPATDGTCLEGTVTLVEPLGREILVRLLVTVGENYPDLTLYLHVAPAARPQLGDRLPLTLDLNQLHVFHPDTGERLEWAS